QTAYGNLQGKLNQIERTLEEVKKNDVSDDLRTEVEDNVRQLTNAMNSVADAVQERIDYRDQRMALTKALTDNHSNFLMLAQPAVGDRKSTRLNSSHVK